MKTIKRLRLYHAWENSLSPAELRIGGYEDSNLFVLALENMHKNTGSITSSSINIEELKTFRDKLNILINQYEELQ